ncbi:TPM domain-containing protein [Candidatus Woesearchaeota archaeon]|nr:TPM domain-containing protein [Candidatus Woesearchaeota archaeon]MBW3006134.1 TPM domain-containing protein [Candidatus Woesearchaeota archaeon]
MNKKPILLLLIFLLLPIVLAEIPAYKGYVTDNANILGDYGTQIEKLCEEIEKNTTAEVAVLTIESLEGEPLEEYSLSIARSWGIGKEEKDNGLLLLISVQDRKYRFETGYGLEGVLPDAKTGRIGRYILTPAFRLEEYGRGVHEALTEIKGLLQEDPSIVAKYQPTTMSTFGGLIVFGYLILLLILLVATERLKKHKWKTRAGADAAILAISLFIGITYFAIAFVLSVMFWILAAQISWMAKHRKSGGIIWGGFGRSSGGFGGGFGGFGGGGFGGGGSSGGW